MFSLVNNTNMCAVAGVLAAVLVVVFTVVMSKKRSSRGKPAKESYMEVSVDDGVSAEDRHIASMQVLLLAEWSLLQNYILFTCCYLLRKCRISG